MVMMVGNKKGSLSGRFIIITAISECLAGFVLQGSGKLEKLI